MVPPASTAAFYPSLYCSLLQTVCHRASTHQSSCILGQVAVGSFGQPGAYYSALTPFFCHHLFPFLRMLLPRVLQLITPLLFGIFNFLSSLLFPIHHTLQTNFLRSACCSCSLQPQWGYAGPSSLYACSRSPSYHITTSLGPAELCIIPHAPDPALLLHLCRQWPSPY